jgi:hypothetical protein
MLLDVPLEASLRPTARLGQRVLVGLVVEDAELHESAGPKREDPQRIRIGEAHERVLGVRQPGQRQEAGAGTHGHVVGYGRRSDERLDQLAARAREDCRAGRSREERLHVRPEGLEIATLVAQHVAQHDLPRSDLGIARIRPKVEICAHDGLLVGLEINQLAQRGAQIVGAP